MSRSVQTILVATAILLSAYLAHDAMAQQSTVRKPVADMPAKQTAPEPVQKEATLESLASDMQLLMRWVGEPKSKRDNLHDMIVRRFNDMEKRFDKIERELRVMRQQVDRIESRR